MKESCILPISLRCSEFMGMGEPLMNLNKVIRAYYWINAHMNIHKRCFKISTVGVPNAIRYLAERKLKLKLAISLHTTDQKLREHLIPSAKDFPMPELFKDCRWYFNQTGCRVTFEVALLRDINDSEAQASHMARKMRQQKCPAHVRLMLWNPVEGMKYEPTDVETAVTFKRVLEYYSIPASIRRSKGLEKAAACGQLSNEFQKRPLKEIVPLG